MSDATTSDAPGGEVFSRIYAENTWGVGSGVGSLPESVVDYVRVLTDFLRTQNIRSIVDFGCGDWQFSKSIDWGERRYLGVDVVPSVIEANTAAYTRENIRFALMTDVDALPSADLLICKDVLQHLPNADVKRYLRAFKRKHKFILITNGIDPPSNTNVDILHGEYRPLLLDAPPFNTPCVSLLEWRVTAYENNIAMRTALVLGEPAKHDPSLRPGSPLYAPPPSLMTQARRWSAAAPRTARSALSRTFVGAAWRGLKRAVRG